MLVEVLEERLNRKPVGIDLAKEESNDVVLGDGRRWLPTAIVHHLLPGLLGLLAEGITSVSNFDV